jgi:hypothetical protein
MAWNWPHCLPNLQTGPYNNHVLYVAAIYSTDCIAFSKEEEACSSLQKISTFPGTKVSQEASSGTEAAPTLLVQNPKAGCISLSDEEWQNVLGNLAPLYNALAPRHNPKSGTHGSDV